MVRRIWPAFALAVVIAPLLALAVNTPAARPRPTVIDEREPQILHKLSRAAQFVDVPHITSAPACEDVHPPEALATPDPLVTPAAAGKKVRVSFIIGIDGRVHSPLILESAGLAGDRHVLQTVRTWRYRPATCNGVPTETEGKVEFSSR